MTIFLFLYLFSILRRLAYLHVWGRIEQLLLMSGDGEDTAFILKQYTLSIFAMCMTVKFDIRYHGVL